MAFTSVTWDGDGITYSIPGQGDFNYSGTLKVDGLLISLARNAVSKTGAQTLTGKTMSGASNTFTLIPYSALTLSLSIVNADVAAAAAIALTKLAATTVSRALVSDASGFVTPATTTATEIGYVNGVTSAIQTQFTGKAATGANSDITSLTAVTAMTRTGGVAITGTNTNDSAGTGVIGEEVIGTVLSGSEVSLSNGVAKTILSVSLTAGDWEVSGSVAFVFAATTTVTQYQAGVSKTTNSLPAPQGAPVSNEISVVFNCASFTPNSSSTQPIPTYRVSISSTTTFFLVAGCAFGTSTCTARGYIHARRIR